MDFSWSTEQLEMCEAARQFALKHLGEDPGEREKTGAFARELWRKCADFGIQGLPMPEQYGGSDEDALTAMLVMEALGYGCPDRGLLFSLHAHIWTVEMPILAFGTDEQKRRYLPGLCDGSLLGAHAMSEPDSGSDAFSMRTRALRQGEHYVLNGSKMFVTNAPEADLFLIFATADRERGMWGVSAFLVERDTEGLSVGKPIAKMGLTTSPMSEVYLDNCHVPAANLLGGEGTGAMIFNHAMGWERSCILASDVGAMQRQLEASIEYAKQRHQFGKPVGSYQLVASRIVDMKLRLETSRLLLYRSAWSQARQGGMSAMDGALAKLYISEAAVQSAMDAIQVRGGYGYMTEYGAERELRDAIGGKLYSGTSEIQRLIIARNLGLKTRN
ncbi:MAG: acyl-CoA dehydrogenase family protein [Rhodocyclaceae bacterium]|nr:acyl-CoA dehydrogenase family protein [Rhodocyclaceae bacterium]